MLVFAHLGLTLAAARQIACANLAFVMMGAMLPDVIDKPLGMVLFGTPAMGRTFAHTLLFLMLLGTAASGSGPICSSISCGSRPARFSGRC